MRWSAVPPGIFDAAENTVAWSVQSAESAVVALVRTEIWGAGSPDGIAVRFICEDYRGAGTLDAAGTATLPLFAGDEPLGEDDAWDHDWTRAVVTVGADADESAADESDSDN